MEAELSKSHREERVVTLLHLLGQEAADQVLERLDSPTTTLLRNRLKTIRDNLPPIRRQKQVIDEFDRFFRFAAGSTGPKLRIHSPDGDESHSDDESPQHYTLTDDPLLDLEKMNIFQLATALNEEQPRTVALLLKTVTPKRVAQLLNLLAEEHREPVVRELSRDPRAPDVILRKIAATTVQRAANFPTEPTKKDDPVQRLVDVLRATEKSKRRNILRAIEDQDPEKAALINQSLYQFEDLVMLEDQQVQQVLSKIDSATLSTALFGADEAIFNKIQQNLSKRARATLQEEMSFKKNVPAAQLKAARDLVVKAISESDQQSE